MRNPEQLVPVSRIDASISFRYCMPNSIVTHVRRLVAKDVGAIPCRFSRLKDGI